MRPRRFRSGRRAAPAVMLAASLTLGLGACDDTPLEDDLEEDIEEGVEDVQEGVEDVGEEVGDVLDDDEDGAGNDGTGDEG